MDAGSLASLEAAVQKLTKTPELLHEPSLAFFRSFLEELGATIPPKQSAKEDAYAKAKAEGDKLKAEAAAMAQAAEEVAAKAAAEAAAEQEELVDDKIVAADEDPGEQPTVGPEWTEENGDKVGNADPRSQSTSKINIVL